MNLTRAGLLIAIIATGTVHAETDSRLLYARMVDGRCEVGTWHSATREAAPAAHVSTCPEDVFVSRDRESAYVIDGEALRIVALAGPAAAREVALPDPDYRAWTNQMEPRPDANPDYLPGGTLKPILAGPLEDGSLGLVVSLWMPADDEFRYLFSYDREGWRIIDGQWCHRFGCSRSFDQVAGDSTVAWSWPEERRIWHPDVDTAPYVVDRTIESANPDVEYWETTIHTLEFEIDGKSRRLRFFVNPSEHYELSYVFGIDLTVDIGQPIELSGNQCLTSLVGRYLLVEEFFLGRFEVTDIGTGETLFGDLKAARWLD